MHSSGQTTQQTNMNSNNNDNDNNDPIPNSNNILDQYNGISTNNINSRSYSSSMDGIEIASCQTTTTTSSSSSSTTTTTTTATDGEKGNENNNGFVPGNIPKPTMIGKSSVSASVSRSNSSLSLRRSTTMGADGAALPSAFYCPLTLCVMRRPVIDREGNSFEKSAIEAWLSNHCTSPITRKPLRYKDLTPNRSLQDAIAERMGADWGQSTTTASLDHVVGNHDNVQDKESNNHNHNHNNHNSSGEDVIFPALSPSFFSSEPRRMVSSFLQEISIAIGKTIKLNSAGVCAFTYDVFTIAIEIPDNIRSFFIHTELSDLKITSNLMNKMLQLNHLQQETRGGCLSIDPTATKPVPVFSYTDRVDEIDATDFRNILENFIDNAMKLHNVLKNM